MIFPAQLQRQKKNCKFLALCYTGYNAAAARKLALIWGAFILWQSANNYRVPRKVKLGILAVTNKETSRMMNGPTHQQCQLVFLSISSLFFLSLLIIKS